MNLVALSIIYFVLCLLNLPIMVEAVGSVYKNINKKSDLTALFLVCICSLFFPIVYILGIMLVWIDKYTK